MYSEKTIIVDVIETGESEYTLSMKASDLYEAAQAGAVLRRNDVGSVAAPEKKYTVLSGVKLASGTYTFTFANGDAFTASSADAYPTAASISNNYAAGGGGGGGTYWVNGSYDADTHALTLDKTAKELFDAASEQAVFLKIPEVDDDGVVVVDDWHVLLLEQFAKDNDGYLFVFNSSGNFKFSASADDEYPTKNFG